MTPSLAVNWLTADLALAALAGVLVARLTERMPAGVPIFSPVVQDTMSRRRLVGVVLAALAIAAWTSTTQSGPQSLATTLFGLGLLLLAILDGEHFWLPRSITWTLAAFGLAEGLWRGLDVLADRLIGAGLGFGLLWGVAFLFRRLRGRDGLGGGDAWLLAAGGAWLGWRPLPTALLVASISGLIFALAPLLRGRRPDPRRPLPFGVFLALGLWLARLYAA